MVHLPESKFEDGIKLKPVDTVEISHSGIAKGIGVPVQV